MEVQAVFGAGSTRNCLTIELKVLDIKEDRAERASIQMLAKLDLDGSRIKRAGKLASQCILFI